MKLDERCPYCGQDVWWQTKDLTIDEIYPVANFCQEYELNERMDGEVHTYCDKYKRELSLTIVKGKIRR